MVPFMRKCGKIRYCRAGHRWLATWRSRFACWIPKATNTHSKHLILIALPQQQWLRERASVLRYTFIACLVPPQLRHGSVRSLLIRVLVLCHEPSRRNCSHLAFVFGFVAIKILLQRWKHIKFCRCNEPCQLTFWPLLRYNLQVHHPRCVISN